MKTQLADAVAKATGAQKCSMTERLRAFRFLYTSGYGEKIGGGVADTMRQLVESGEIGEANDR